MNSLSRASVAAQNPPRIAFVQSCWHRDIVDQGYGGLLEKLPEYGIAAEQVSRFEVPGAFELPLRCKKLANSGAYDMVVAAGLVVDGGIYRHEFVAEAVISGLMQVQLATEVPVLSLVLTPHHFHESLEHQEFFHAHFRRKGHEIANAIALLAGTAARREVGA